MTEAVLSPFDETLPWNFSPLELICYHTRAQFKGWELCYLWARLDASSCMREANSGSNGTRQRGRYLLLSNWGKIESPWLIYRPRGLCCPENTPQIELERFKDLGNLKDIDAPLLTSIVK